MSKFSSLDEKKLAAVFHFVDSARSKAGHAQRNISGDRQSGNYPRFHYVRVKKVTDQPQHVYRSVWLALFKQSMRQEGVN